MKAANRMNSKCNLETLIRNHQKMGGLMLCWEFMQSMKVVLQLITYYQAMM